MKKVLQLGPVFIIAAALLWSFDGILRRSLFVLPPAVIVFWEHLLGAFILLPLLFIKRNELKTLNKKEWGSIILVSLFSGALGTIFYTKALGLVNYIQFSVVVLLQQLQPIWAIATASVILKEKVTGNFLKWAGLAIIASYFVTFKDLTVNLQAGNGTLIAAGLALFAGVMWGSSTSFSKIVLQKVSFSTATFLRFWIAPVFALLFVFSQNQQNLVLTLNTSQWLTLLMITFSTGMVALLIYYYGLKKTPARVSAICELVWPASAIFIDYFYFKNTLSLTQIAGVIVLLFSIFKISQFKK